MEAHENFQDLEDQLQAQSTGLRSGMMKEDVPPGFWDRSATCLYDDDYDDYDDHDYGVVSHPVASSLLSHNAPSYGRSNSISMLLFGRKSSLTHNGGGVQSLDTPSPVKKSPTSVLDLFLPSSPGTHQNKKKKRNQQQQIQQIQQQQTQSHQQQQEQVQPPSQAQHDALTMAPTTIATASSQRKKRKEKKKVATPASPPQHFQTGDQRTTSQPNKGQPEYHPQQRLAPPQGSSPRRKVPTAPNLESRQSASPRPQHHQYTTFPIAKQSPQQQQQQQPLPPSDASPQFQSDSGGDSSHPTSAIHREGSEGTDNDYYEYDDSKPEEDYGDETDNDYDYDDSKPEDYRDRSLDDDTEMDYEYEDSKPEEFPQDSSQDHSVSEEETEIDYEYEDSKPEDFGSSREETGIDYEYEDSKPEDFGSSREETEIDYEYEDSKPEDEDYASEDEESFQEEGSEYDEYTEEEVDVSTVAELHDEPRTQYDIQDGDDDSVYEVVLDTNNDQPQNKKFFSVLPPPSQPTTPLPTHYQSIVPPPSGEPSRRQSEPFLLLPETSDVPRRQSAPAVSALMTPLSPMSTCSKVLQKSESDVASLKDFRLVYGSSTAKQTPTTLSPTPKQSNRFSSNVVMAPRSPLSTCSKSLFKSESDPVSLKDFRHVYGKSTTEPPARRQSAPTATLPALTPMEAPRRLSAPLASAVSALEIFRNKNEKDKKAEDDPSIATTTSVRRGSALALKDFRLAYASGSIEDSMSSGNASQSLRSLKDFHTAYHSSSEEDTESESEKKVDNIVRRKKNKPHYSLDVMVSKTHSSGTSSGMSQTSLKCHSSNGSSSIRSMASTIASSAASSSRLKCPSSGTLDSNSQQQQPEPAAREGSDSPQNSIPLPLHMQPVAPTRERVTDPAAPSPQPSEDDAESAADTSLCLLEDHIEENQVHANDDYSFAVDDLVEPRPVSKRQQSRDPEGRKSSLDTVSHTSTTSTHSRRLSGDDNIAPLILEPGHRSFSKRSDTQRTRKTRNGDPAPSSAGQGLLLTTKKQQPTSGLEPGDEEKTRLGHSSSPRSKQKSKKPKKQRTNTRENNGFRRKAASKRWQRPRRVHFNHAHSSFTRSGVQETFQYYRTNDAPMDLLLAENQPTLGNDDSDDVSFNLLNDKDYSSLRQMLGKEGDLASSDDHVDEESAHEWNRIEQLLHRNESDEGLGYDEISPSVDDSLDRLSSAHRSKCRFWFSKLYFATDESEAGKGKTRKKTKSNVSQTELALPQLSHFLELPLMKTHKVKPHSSGDYSSSVHDSSAHNSITETTRSLTSNYSSLMPDDRSRFSFVSTSKHHKMVEEEHTLRGLEDFFCSDVIDGVRALHVHRILQAQKDCQKRGAKGLGKEWTDLADQQDWMEKSIRKVSLRSSRSSRHMAQQLAKFDTYEALRAVLSQWKKTKKNSTKSKSLSNSKKNSKTGANTNPYLGKGSLRANRRVH